MRCVTISDLAVAYGCRCPNSTLVAIVSPFFLVRSVCRSLSLFPYPSLMVPFCHSAPPVVGLFCFFFGSFSLPSGEGAPSFSPCAILPFKWPRPFFRLLRCAQASRSFVNCCPPACLLERIPHLLRSPLLLMALCPFLFCMSFFVCTSFWLYSLVEYVAAMKFIFYPYI